MDGTKVHKGFMILLLNKCVITGELYSYSVFNMTVNTLPVYCDW